MSALGLAAQERGRSKTRGLRQANTPSRLNAKHNAFLMECDIGLYIRLPTPLELSLEVDASQDNAWRSAFELQCYVFASRTVFNPIAESHELGLTLVRLGPRQAFQTIHGGGRDCAWDLSLTVDHRKQHDHPVKFIANKATTSEGHLTYSLNRCSFSPRKVEHKRAARTAFIQPSLASRSKSSNIAATRSR
jgi:hypothetical protein